MIDSSWDLYLWAITLCVFIFLLDDLFIDAVAFLKKLKPQSIAKGALNHTHIEKKNLAVMIANWQEQDVLEAMVRGNMQSLTYQNLHFFLGVYPNDLATMTIAKKMSQNFPHVHMVVNALEGPTYKGQMLNEIIKSIFLYESENQIKFDGFILHDSEDVLDSNIPYLYSYGLDQADFVQTPVLSLQVEPWQLVAGTYVDEFVEGHLKELLVRQHLGAAIPSAGVGTCLSRALVLKFLLEQNGTVFLPDSLTEDYQLGLQTAKWGMKSTFLCHYLQGFSVASLIATKEFFPHKYFHAVRQKTRWTTGIAFQGSRNIGWFGSFWQKYFLWRDRKGPLNAILTANVILILLALTLFDLGTSASQSGLKIFLIANTIGMFARLAVRIRLVKQVYGLTTAILVPTRWPVAMVINMHAGLRSIYQFYKSAITGKKIKWSKTQHRMPEGFGDADKRTELGEAHAAVCSETQARAIVPTSETKPSMPAPATVVTVALSSSAPLTKVLASEEVQWSKSDEV